MRIKILIIIIKNNNNNNKNNQDNVYGAVIMSQSHCESSPSSHDECRTVPDGCRPLDQDEAIGPPVVSKTPSESLPENIAG